MKIIVTGSIAFDHIMSMPGQFADHIMPDKIHMLNVSFFMDTFRKEFGGTGGNIAYSLGLLGAEVVLSGAVGNDFSLYRKHLEKFKKIDLSGVREFKELATAQGFAMTDKNDNQIWGFYTGALAETAKIKINKFLTRDSYLLVAPNEVKASMEYVRAAIEKKVPYMFDPAFNIAHFSVKDLRLAVKNADVLVGNDYEMELIRRRLQGRKAAKLQSPKNQVRITTMGAKGSLIERGSESYKIPVAKVRKVVDPTGAGDAYRAGFMAGYSRGFDLEVCGQMGAVSSAYAVENYGTQTFTYSKAEFVRRYKNNFGRKLEL